MGADDDIRWDQMTIPRMLRRAAERFGDALAFADEGTCFSFAELAAAGEGALIGRIIPRGRGWFQEDRGLRPSRPPS